MRKLVVLLCIISIIQANPRIRGYHSITLSTFKIFISRVLDEALTASLSSPYEYDVIENPLQITVSFSQDVSEFDSHHCIVIDTFPFSIVVSKCKSQSNSKAIFLNISNNNYPRKAWLLIHFLITLHYLYNEQIINQSSIIGI